MENFIYWTGFVVIAAVVLLIALLLVAIIAMGLWKLFWKIRHKLFGKGIYLILDNNKVARQLRKDILEDYDIEETKLFASIRVVQRKQEGEENHE